MKKLLLAVLMLFGSTALFAQNASEVRGKISIENAKDVKLSYVEDGTAKQYALTNIAPDGSYGFIFNAPREAFYVLEVRQKEYPIYIKPGDNVNIDITENGPVLKGKNTEENIALNKWESYSNNVKEKAIYFMGKNSTYVDFFPDFEKYAEGFQAMYDNVKSRNAKFNEILKAKMKYDIDYYAISFLCTPRSAHAKSEDVISYYRNIISKDKFNSDVVLSLYNGSRIMSIYAVYLSINKEGLRDLNAVLEYFKNDTLKGEYAITHNRVKDYVGYETFAADYGKYLVTPSQKKRLEDLCAKVANSKPGEKAADFTYPDINGKMVSLSDFKGKVVFIDVWATWCGPCKKEIPYLKTLEKELHGNSNIVFMGVSLDEEKDKDKWMAMVKDEQLGGVQLFASGWSKIAKDYKINGIPRFLIFDKKGNIYSINAPRPSNPELKGILLKLAAE